MSNSIPLLFAAVEKSLSGGFRRIHLSYNRLLVPLLKKITPERYSPSMGNKNLGSPWQSEIHDLYEPKILQGFKGNVQLKARRPRDQIWRHVYEVLSL